MKDVDFLITGSNGLLGQKIIKELINRNFKFVATSKGENRNSLLAGSDYRSLDLTSIKSFEEVSKEYRPKFIINTAALTNVDSCENQKELCDQLNVQAVKWLLDYAQETESKLVHLSTDFVFDGEHGPYSENDNTNGLSYYGKSKEKSEKILENSSYKNWSIVRTIIVYGTADFLSRSNIVLWAMETFEKGGEMNIVDDQFRSPTFAEDLAEGCISICEKNKTGIYHLSGEKTYSIYDFVLSIGNYFNYNTSLVNRISSSTLNQLAKRPPRTGFDISKAKIDLNFHPRTLEESLGILEKQLKG